MDTTLLSNQQYAMLTKEQALENLQSSERTGLSSAQVTKRQGIFGLNEVPAQRYFWWHILLSQFKSPFICILMLIAVVTFFLSDSGNAIIILACVFLNTIMGFVQEYKADQSMRVLKNYLATNVTVLRDGKEQEVPSSSLVPGDILLLYPGDIIPADVRFIKDDHVTVDESLLTGESEPVAKEADYMPTSTAALANTLGFTGTVILTGKAVGVVIATGVKSSLGMMSTVVNQHQRVSGFSINIQRFSYFILWIIVATIGVVFVAHLLMHAGHVDVLNLTFFAIALGITVIPEALPVVTSFAFTRGALQLAKHKVVVKRLSAIEDLGSIEVLCTDKTGTITENKLAIVALYGLERDVFVHAVLGSGLCPRSLSVSKGFDAVLWQALTLQEQEMVQQYQKVAEIPFDPQRRRSVALYNKDGLLSLIARGAAQEVLSCIDQADQNQAMHTWLHEQGAKGRRIIAVAAKKYPAGATVADLKQEERDMQLIGMIAFEDPLKPTANKAIQKARKLGVQIKIITGDSVEVCAAIAHKVGLIKTTAQVVSGDDFARKTKEEKRKLVHDAAAFARINPLQKYEIIQLLQEQYRVGYMGDGINDAPALKIAHVALAVTDAADIARDAADIILLSPSLQVIINGIEEGRIIFANTLKYLNITLAASFGHFYALAIASLLIDAPPMLATQLLILNFLTDIPLISLSTDTVDQQTLQAPQQYDLKGMIIRATMLAIIITTFDFIIFGFYYKKAAIHLQTVWFIMCVLTELAFIFSARTVLPFYKAAAPSRMLVLLCLLVAGVSIALPYIPLTQGWFHFMPLSAHDMLVIGLLVCGCFIATECAKMLYHRFYKDIDI
jgi:P-type Mg2+ transporter